MNRRKRKADKFYRKKEGILLAGTIMNENLQTGNEAQKKQTRIGIWGLIIGLIGIIVALVWDGYFKNKINDPNEQLYKEKEIEIMLRLINDFQTTNLTIRSIFSRHYCFLKHWSKTENRFYQSIPSYKSSNTLTVAFSIEKSGFILIRDADVLTPYSPHVFVTMDDILKADTLEKDDSIYYGLKLNLLSPWDSIQNCSPDMSNTILFLDPETPSFFDKYFDQAYLPVKVKQALGSKNFKKLEVETISLSRALSFKRDFFLINLSDSELHEELSLTTPVFYLTEQNSQFFFQDYLSYLSLLKDAIRQWCSANNVEFLTDSTQKMSSARYFELISPLPVSSH